jgi:hypothetical protein
MARRRPPALLALGVVLAGLAVSGCYSTTASTSGPQAAAEIFLGGSKVTGATPAPTLAVTPGGTTTVDLAKTTLRGKVGRAQGGADKNNAKVLSKCIARAEWAVIGADGVPLGAPHAGSKTWIVDTGNTVDACASGATERTIDVVMPADVTGHSLSITVFSASCRDRACAQASSRRSTRGIAPRKDSPRWITGTAVVKLVAVGPDDGPALPPQLVVRMNPFYKSNSSGSLFREVDARLLGTAAGTTYEWDLNGDGIYTDVSDQPDPIGRVMPSGVAAIPYSDLSGVTPGTEHEVGVRVTVPGAAAVTSRAKLKVVYTGGCSPTYRCFNEAVLSSAAPTVGSTLTLTIRPNFGFQGRTAPERACLDLNGNGYYERGIDIAPSEVSKQVEFAARAAGAHLVQVAFVDSGVDCAAAASQSNSYVFRDVYVSQAAVGASASRQAAAAYTGAATVRLSKTITIKPAQMAGYELKNELLRGRYTFRTPAKGRPKGLAAFTGGDYVQKIDTIRLTPNATGSETTVTGVGTMLLRGKKGALLCTAIESSAVATTYRFSGGTGAGATLTGEMTSPPLDFKGSWERASGLKVVKGVQVQTKPLTEQGTVTAATGGKTALPTACKALVKHLPKAKKPKR